METRAPNAPSLSLKGVSRSFGKTVALRDVSLEIAQGERAALVGPNGAGKSTLLKIICGALRPDSGQIALQGLSPARARTQAGFLGWLPERAPLNADLTVAEHLRLSASFRGLKGQGAAAEIERVAAALGLQNKLARLAGRLSLGTRRLAALALAFLGSPRFLVLDEPTSGLDPDGARLFQKLVASLPASSTLLISSHVLPELFNLTAKINFLKNGSLVYSGTYEEIDRAFPPRAGEEGLQDAGPGAAACAQIYFRVLYGS
ncbi:MAG: ABC transporter ATP-binding protein [Deltaproteobacteria bacterium]|jgi:ABC-type multidrug transport system ATPase subunit|nr:ABC transporter ATP-binding protein [Deltaproteobacteria bacterium]